MQTGTDQPVFGPTLAPQAAGLPNAHRNNGFDLLRVIAAVMVIYGHAHALAGAAVPGFLGNAISTIGVKIFFITSGFLITKSWIADPSLPRFALRRALRILPGLAFISLLTVFVLGPFFTFLPLAEYFRYPATYHYFWNVALYPIYDLPGVFAKTHYPIAVNGSLWSLPAEVLMYILTPMIIGTSPRAGRLTILLSAAGFAAAAVYYLRVVTVSPPPVIYGTSLISVLDAAPYFQIGALYAVFGLERFARPILSVAMLFTAYGFVHRAGGSAAPIAETLLLVLLPFTVISIGCERLVWIEKPLASADISYGLYLYGFPITQCLASLTDNGLTGRSLFLLTMPLAIICALLSWLLIERYALRWKPRRPRA